MIAAKNTDTTLDQLARMMADGFDRMENRFDAIDLRFEAVDDRFESLEKKFDVLARESMRLDDDIHDVKNNLSSLMGIHVEQETTIESLDERVALLEIKAQ